MQPFPGDAVRVQDLVSQAVVIECCLNTMKILNALGHPVRRTSPGCADLQDAMVHLNIVGENMAAYISKNVGIDQNSPEPLSILMADLALIGSGKAIHGKHRMVAKYDFIFCVGMLLEGCL